MTYPISEVQVSVVAKIVAPNLSPIIHRPFGTKNVVLLHTANFLVEAKRLAAVYKTYQIKTELIQLTNAFELDALTDEFSDILYRYIDDKPLVNINNGTKLMSIALYDVAKTLELPTYYVNPNDSISWLWPRGLADIQLEDRIKIPAFLSAHGLEFIEDRPPTSEKSYRDALEWMVGNLTRLNKAIPQLNFYAFSADKELVSKPLKNPSDELFDLISELTKTGLVRLQNNQLYFISQEARFFANGGWLEEYIHHQIRQLSAKVPEIHDYRCSVLLKTQDHEVKNEVDNMILVNNHLYLIECKTKRFNGRGLPDGGAMDALYKMDTLMAELGGPLTRGMLVSVFPFSKAEIRRAKQYSIKLVSFEHIQNIQSELINWFALPKNTD